MFNQFLIKATKTLIYFSVKIYFTYSKYIKLQASTRQNLINIRRRELSKMESMHATQTVKDNEILDQLAELLPVLQELEEQEFYHGL